MGVSVKILLRGLLSEDKASYSVKELDVCDSESIVVLNEMIKDGYSCILRRGDNNRYVKKVRGLSSVYSAVMLKASCNRLDIVNVLFLKDGKRYGPRRLGLMVDRNDESCYDKYNRDYFGLSLRLLLKRWLEEGKASYRLGVLEESEAGEEVKSCLNSMIGAGYSCVIRRGFKNKYAKVIRKGTGLTTCLMIKINDNMLDVVHLAIVKNGKFRRSKWSEYGEVGGINFFEEM